MFKVNDVIVYGLQGVCQIVDVEEKIISGEKKEYFVLKTINDKEATLYVPVDNEYVLKKMRYLLTKDEIDSLIDTMPDINPVWIANDNERKEHYRKVIECGDHLEMIKIIKAVNDHKKECKAKHKRLHMTDIRFSNDAERLLCSEFQYVLKLDSREELKEYIVSRIEK